MTNFAAQIAALDLEIADLQASRADATCKGELEAINDGIEAARAARRSLFRTRR